MEGHKGLSMEMTFKLLDTLEAIFVIDYNTLICESCVPSGLGFKEICRNHEFVGKTMSAGLHHVCDEYVVYEDKPLLVHDLMNVKNLCKNKNHHTISFRASILDRNYTYTLNFVYYNGEEGEKVILYVSNINDQYITDDLVANQLMLLATSPNFISAYFYFTESHRLLRYRKEKTGFVKEFLNVTIEEFVAFLTNNIARPSDYERVKLKLNVDYVNNCSVGDEFHLYYDAHLYRAAADPKIYPLDVLTRVIEITDEKVVCCYATYDYIKENQELQEKEKEFAYIIQNTFKDMRANIIKVDADSEEVMIINTDPNNNLQIRRHNGDWKQLSAFLMKFVHPDDQYLLVPYLVNSIKDLPLNHSAELEFRYRLDSLTLQPVSAKYLWYKSYIKVYNDDGHKVLSLFNLDITDNVVTAQKSEELITRFGSMTRSLTSNYRSIIYFDSKHDEIEFVKQDPLLEKIYPGFYNKHFTYQEGVDMFLPLVVSEDANIMKNFINVDRIRRGLKMVDNLSMVFRVENPLNGTIHTFRCHTTRVEGGDPNDLVLGFENVDKEVMLKTQATTDHLTNVFNRQAMYEYLERDDPFADKTLNHYVMVMDADHFKEINDNFGHLEGDKALIRIGKTLKDVIVEVGNSFVCRHGGDEFVCIVGLEPEANIDQLVDKIFKRLTLANLEANAPYCLEMSIGYAKYEEGMSLDNLISIADKRMYQVKADHHKKL